jgi:O-acetyl-ADP-ribose deacetylase (regulator of RNase III)
LTLLLEIVGCAKEDSQFIIVTHSPILLGMPFQIIRNDITKVKADAIVNTANPKPIIGGGTDRAIYAAAGEKRLLAERKKIGNIERGKAQLTPAFDLSAKYVIHTVGPV